MAEDRQPQSVEDAMALLRQGNANYVGEQMQHPLITSERRALTGSVQNPWAIVLTCADSRVSPELVFDCGIGELFVIRVAGNTANACTIASIEYAVLVLGVKLIVVLGHQNCGAVKAALSGGSYTYNINQLLGHLKRISAEFGAQWSSAPADQQDAIQDSAASKNAEYVAEDLRVQSSNIEGADGLVITPALYSTATGEVNWGPWAS